MVYLCSDKNTCTNSICSKTRQVFLQHDSGGVGTGASGSREKRGVKGRTCHSNTTAWHGGSMNRLIVEDGVFPARRPATNWRFKRLRGATMTRGDIANYPAILKPASSHEVFSGVFQPWLPRHCSARFSSTLKGKVLGKACDVGLGSDVGFLGSEFGGFCCQG